MKIAFILIMFILVLSSPAYAQWDDCSMGEKNCTGKCGAYVDTTNDSLCDHSQPEPTYTVGPVEKTQVTTAVGGSYVKELITGQDLKTKTILEAASIYQIDVNKFISGLEKEIGGIKLDQNTSFQLMHDNYGLSPSRVKEIADGLANGTNTVKDSITTSASKPNREGTNYYLIPIFLVLSLLYGISWYAVKRKKITLLIHRKIWNLGLLTSFLGLATLSMLLVLRSAIGLIVNLPFNITFWHVELGIIMICISLFHIFWHLSYFKLALSPKSAVK